MMKKFKTASLLALFTVFCSVASYSQESETKVVDEVVAQVNDGVITLSRVNREVKDAIDSLVAEGKSKEDATKMIEEKRGELIANNLANADTPGYQARDIDFRQAMARASGGATTGVTLSTTQSGHIGSATSADAATNPDLKYRTPLAPALDGNTVDAQIEQAAFAENAVRYQATLTFLNSKFRGLLTAILGS